MATGLPQRHTDGWRRLLMFDELAPRLVEPPISVNRPRSDEGRARIAATAPELILSIRYGGILDAEHAQLPRHGIINLHSGRLPEYRGVLASFRAVMAGDSELCCTLHRITDAGIDTGPVIDSCRVPLLRERSLLFNVLRLYAPGVELIRAAVERLTAGDALPGKPQAHAGNYFSAPDADELRTFAERGHRLSDLDEIIGLLRWLLLDRAASGGTDGGTDNDDDDDLLRGYREVWPQG